jgi:hypothetical protein
LTDENDLRGKKPANSTGVAASTHAETFQTERTERLFYLIACLLMIVGVPVGFHMFYLHGLSDAEQSVTQEIAPWFMFTADS